jgi:hypothetical protein
MNKQIALSVEQMKHLASLGIDTSKASLCWVKEPNSWGYSLHLHDEYCYDLSALEPVPAFTLQDLIELMPSDLKHGRMYKLSIRPNNAPLVYCWGCRSYKEFKSFREQGGTLMRSGYNMILRLIENGCLNQNNDEMEKV